MEGSIGSVEITTGGETNTTMASNEVSFLEPEDYSTRDSMILNNIENHLKEFVQNHNHPDERQIPNSKTICEFYLNGSCRFGDECFNLHLGEVTIKPKKKEGRVKNIDHINNEKKSSKKPPLRTAGDVRKRIQWDEDLPEEYFYIGYLDRFEGVIEQHFLAFNWDHIATVGIDDLAIPQHRIQYFKYKDRKVWDKNERLDLVFGSAGNEKLIYEVMKEVDEIELLKSDSDDSDDEDAIITTAQSGNTEILNNCIRTAAQYDAERATHFICIRVNNEKVKKDVMKIQQHVLDNDPSLRGCTMPDVLLHITLAMVKCATPASIYEVYRSIEKLIPSLQLKLGSMATDAISQQRIIKAEGLSTFGARVLYAKMDVPSTFMDVVNLFRAEINSIKDACVTNHFDFVPHMTLLKVNRVVARERMSKYIDSRVYTDYMDHNFGAIRFDNIHFCSIEDGRDYDGFYITIKKYDV